MLRSLRWPLLAYFLSLVLYSFLSYSLTDPNLVLSSWTPYWHWQQWMWQNIWQEPVKQTWLFGANFAFLFGSYFWLITAIQSLKQSLNWKHVGLLIAICTAPLFFSYNALSHDVFNYIFNAKMVVTYHQNPHQHVALDFPDDTWIRFMHNTHTPAPYGYGWTVLSLIPYAFGVGKFTLTWLVFRGWNILAVAGVTWLLYQLFTLQHRKPKTEVLESFWRDVLIVMTNPLWLIEFVSNQHNDLWMILPALASLYFIWPRNEQFQRRIPRIILSFGLLALSISTKLATLLLLPIWFFLLIGKLPKNWAFYCSLLLFIPLLTARSQFFHPWYLSWAFVWLPFIKQKSWRTVLLAFSVTSLFRYLPWIWAGEYSDTVLQQQYFITWSAALIGPLWFIWQQRKKTS